MTDSDKEQRERLKDLLRKIHKGEEDVDKIKEDFRGLLSEISPQEIPSIEQEMVKEGVTPDEIAEMCDVHLELFRDSVEDKYDLTKFPDGHPLKTLYKENERITKDAELLNLRISSLREAESQEEIGERLKDLEKLASQLLKVDRTHYTRQEMIVFPHIEKREIKAVPRVLWRKHNENMSKIRGLLNFISKKPKDREEFLDKLEDISQELSKDLLDMVFRENNILYPTLKGLLSEREWIAIKEQEGEIGYYKIEPGEDWDPKGEPEYPYEVEEEISESKLSELPEQLKTIIGDREIEPDEYKIKENGDMELSTGFLNQDEVNSILNTIPIDVTFIDENNRVKFFTTSERIFPRTRSVIGRPVKFCHPPGSVEKVNKILEKFKKGEREKAEFWIEMKGRFIHIRYFPVRNEGEEYLGTVEVTQDITELKELEGEKRIMDWE